MFVHLFFFSFNIQTKGRFFWPGSTPVTWFSEKYSLSTLFLPSVQSVTGSQHEQTGRGGQVEVDESLAAMFQTAEVRPWMLQLLLWHPEKWETQDVGAKPSVTADQRAVLKG